MRKLAIEFQIDNKVSLPKRLSCHVLRIFRVDLPNEFYYSVTVFNGEVCGSFGVTMGFFDLKRGLQFTKDYDKRMRVFDFLNSRQEK
jgi:hypothetical protein